MDYQSVKKRILDQFKDPKVKFAYVDLFCGAGGTSTGVNRSKYARVVACVNHDKNAIASHAANHPNALHFIEDIRTINLAPVVQLVQEIRQQFPHIKIVLWASLECTNFSKAKGGMPRDADSRTLAEHLYRYINLLHPDYIKIENVVEFMAWGPLDENGKPVSRKNGSDWLRWRGTIRSFGYRDDWKELNSANFGANTSRNRLFGVFARPSEPIIWPDATHTKNPGKPNLFGATLKKWLSVRECIDFSNKGKSIFSGSIKAEATFERVYKGLLKFFPGADEAFLSKYYSGHPESKNISVNGPSGALTTKDGHSVVFIVKYNGTRSTGEVHPGVSINDTCPTITVQQRLALANVSFLTKYYSSGGQWSGTDEPSGALTTKDRMSVVFIDQRYDSSAQPHLVSSSDGCPAIAIYNSDSAFVRKIKLFMAHYGIADIKMRMLLIPELLRIQGFGDGYVLKGTQTEQKKYIGNAVVPHVVEAWVNAMGEKLEMAKQVA